MILSDVCTVSIRLISFTNFCLIFFVYFFSVFRDLNLFPEDIRYSVATLKFELK